MLGNFWWRKTARIWVGVLSACSFWWKLNRVLGFHCVWVVAPDVLNGHQRCSCWNGERAFEIWEEEREISLSNKLFLRCTKFKYLWWPLLHASHLAFPGHSHMSLTSCQLGDPTWIPPTVTSMCMLPSSFRFGASLILGSGMESVTTRIIYI